MYVKDINMKEVLEEFAKHQGQWAFWWDDNRLSWGYDSERQWSNILVRFPRKVVHRFFQKMYKKGYIGGCDCGCRGDFEITDKGLELIKQPRIKPYTGY